MLVLSIPKPCHENWNEMSPSEHGAFCKVCAKTVVDFTSLSDEEVKNYFLQRTGEKTCGRFRNDQLSEPASLEELLLRPIPFWKKFLAILCIVFASFLSSCQDTTKGKVDQVKAITLGEPEIKSEYIETDFRQGDIKPDTSFCEDRCSTMGTPAIITEGIVEPPLIEVDGVLAIEALEEPEEKPDTSLVFMGGIKIDTVKKVDPAFLKVDSVRKNLQQKDCDTLPARTIEP